MTKDEAITYLREHLSHWHIGDGWCERGRSPVPRECYLCNCAEALEILIDDD